MFAIMGDTTNCKDIDVEWHFFQANHGKRAVNGVGTVIKNSVFRRVQSQDIVIQEPKHFADFAHSALKSITVLYVENPESGHHEECQKCLSSDWHLEST